MMSTSNRSTTSMDRSSRRSNEEICRLQVAASIRFRMSKDEFLLTLTVSILLSIEGLLLERYR